MNYFKKSGLKPWELELIEKYPLIFLEQLDEQKDDHVNLRFGFECESGWTNHIEEIAKVGTELVQFLRNLDISANDAYIHSFIVKEKFGTLRWQGDANLPEPFYRLWLSFVSSEEGQSAFTCELTGKYGSTYHTKGGKSAWVKTLCKEKAIELGYDLNPSPFD